MIEKTRYAVVALAILAAGCTEQIRAKSFGGDMAQEIPCGTRLVTATWKGDANLWFLLRKLEEGETPRRYSFKESSNWGAMEGSIKFEEHRCK